MDSTSTDPPRTLVIGPGAIGAFIAARLTLADWPVRVQARGDTLRQLRDGPLTLDDDAERHVVDLDVVPEPRDAGPTDLAIVCTKSFDTPEVARRLVECGPEANATVLSLQNGVHNPGILAEALPWAAVGAAAVYLGCERRSPRHVLRRPSRNPETGEVRDRLIGGPEGAAGAALEALGSAIGVRTEVVEDPAVPLWTKLIANVALNTVTALGRARVGAVFSRPDAKGLMLALGEEVVRVAHAKGIPLPADAARDYVEDAERRLPSTGGSSTLFDLESGRRLEREALVGAVVEEAAQLGVEVPYCAACDALMRLVNPTIAPARGRGGDLT